MSNCGISNISPERIRREGERERRIERERRREREGERERERERGESREEEGREGERVEKMEEERRGEGGEGGGISPCYQRQWLGCVPASVGSKKCSFFTQAVVMNPDMWPTCTL